jgi:hypothetical protein
MQRIVIHISQTFLLVVGLVFLIFFAGKEFLHQGIILDMEKSSIEQMYGGSVEIIGPMHHSNGTNLYLVFLRQEVVTLVVSCKTEISSLMCWSQPVDTSYPIPPDFPTDVPSEAFRFIVGGLPYTII